MSEHSYIKIDVIFEKNITVSSDHPSATGGRIILKGEDFALLPHKAEVEIVGYLPDGIVLMTGKVTVSTRSQLNVNVTKTDEKLERRSCLKVRTKMALLLRRAYSLGKRHIAYTVDQPILTRDLSIGGIGFYSNSVLFESQRIEIDLSVLKPDLLVEAVVLRKERGFYRGGFRYKYGCHFLNVSGEKERVLCEFVLQTQLKNYNKLHDNKD
mgnify:CR=1 FL=1